MQIVCGLAKGSVVWREIIISRLLQDFSLPGRIIVYWIFQSQLQFEGRFLLTLTDVFGAISLLGFSCRALILIGSEVLAGVGLLALVAGSVLALAGGGSGSSCSSLICAEFPSICIDWNPSRVVHTGFSCILRLQGGRQIFTPRTSLKICIGG